MNRDIRFFTGHGYEFLPNRKPVPMLVREPSAGCNAGTGILLLVHYWEGTYHQLFASCEVMADRYNLVTVTVNYLESGKDDDKIPYDLGLIQTMDCLRALYHVQKSLRGEGKPFDARRIYVAGQSGGGQIALMCAKLAPNTFSLVFDMCGVSGLSDNVAFDTSRPSGSARWERDPRHPWYLSPAKQEIRNPGDIRHLAQAFARNPGLKYVIVHSLDDTNCPVLDKIGIFCNMIRVGYRPSTCFVSPAEVDGEAITTNQHHLCSQVYKVYCKYGEPFLKPGSPLMAHKDSPTDFELKGKISYPVTEGHWLIDYSSVPQLNFLPER